MTSTPSPYIAAAIDLPFVGSLNPVKSGGWVMYLTSTVALGLTALAPAVKPASNFLIRSFSTPPMKPSLPDLEAHAAATPTRKEPSCSAKVIERTFGASVVVGLPSAPSVYTTESTIEYSCFGFCAADAVTASPQRNPTATMRSCL